MNRLTLLTLLAIVLVEVHSASWHRDSRAVTEPAWVTELLGPTMFPPTTTRRPTLPDRIQLVIQQVSDTIRQFPDRVGDILNGVRQAASNILRRQTTTPKVNPAVPAVTTAPAVTVPPTAAPAPNATVV